MAHRTLKKLVKKLPAQLKHAAAQKSSGERVHKLRVICRKTSAALKLFAAFLPEKKSHRLEKQLEKILDATGAARDIGVMAKHKGAFASVLRQEKVGAHRPLEKKARNRKLLETAGVAALKAIDDAAHGGPTLFFHQWVRPEIAALATAFFAVQPPNNSDVKELHKFRILGKQLRYAIEISEEAFQPALRKKVLARMETIQDRLGKINDLASENKYLVEWMQDPRYSGIAPRMLERIAANRLEIEKRKAAFEKWCRPDFVRRFRRDIAKMLAA